MLLSLIWPAISYAITIPIDFGVGVQPSSFDVPQGGTDDDLTLDIAVAGFADFAGTVSGMFSVFGTSACCTRDVFSGNIDLRTGGGIFLEDFTTTVSAGELNGFAEGSGGVVRFSGSGSGELTTDVLAVDEPTSLLLVFFRCCSCY
jgi:hypothetical protein